MNKRIYDYVSPRTEPDFFDRPDDILKEIQGEIRRGIETASEVMTITVDQELKERAEKKLSEFGWTLEEAFILYLYWCITCPRISLHSNGLKAQISPFGESTSV